MAGQQYFVEKTVLSVNPNMLVQYNRPPETSALLEKSLLQKCPNQLSFSSSKCQNVSSASTTTNALQQSMQHTIVLTSTGNIKVQNALQNHQPHVKVIDNLQKDPILQGGLTGGGYFGVLLTQTQMINPCQQRTCMPKGIHHQQHAPQKAIAVVSPLNQQIVESVTVSKDRNKMEGNLQTGFRLGKTDQQSYISAALQSTANESGVKESHDYTVQTKEMTSESVLTCRYSQSVKNNKLTGQRESLSSVPHNSVSMKRMKDLQKYPMDNNSRATFPSEDGDAVMGRNCRRNKLSTLPVNEWSLQRLEVLVNELEQMQKKQQKVVPFNDLSKEILKSYWNGDYRKLCSAAKSNVYINIMKDVKLHCGKTNSSIILQEVLREDLNEIASTVHILEHGTPPPKTAYRSSWLNPSPIRCDDKKYGSLSTLMTLHSKPQFSDKEAPVKDVENTPDPTSKSVKTSINSLCVGETSRKQVQNSSSVKSDIVLRKEATVMDVEKSSCVKETGLDIMTEPEMLVKRAQSEQQHTSDEKEATSLVSLSRQSQDVSGSCINSEAPINDLAPVLDKIGFASNTKKDDDAHVLTEPKVPIAAELFDKDKNHTATKMKSDKTSSQIKIYWQLEHYCCPQKWFQHLGYINKGLCRCVKKAELNQNADSSGKDSQKLKANKRKHSFHKGCKLIGCDVCLMRSKRLAKKRLEHRRMTKKCDDNDYDNTSVDEIEIVDVFTDSEDVLKLSNAISEQLKEQGVTTGRKHCREHQKEITKPKSKVQDTKLHFALFGTSHLRQKKQMSEFMSSYTLPPETIKVRLNSGCSESPANTTSHTPKQQVWNSWKESYVPLKTSTDRKSKKKKRTKTPKSKNDAEQNSGIKTTAFALLSSLLSHEDTETHKSEAKHKNASSLAPTGKRKHGYEEKSNKKSRKNVSFKRMNQLKNLERRNFLPSFNRNKIWNSALHGTKLKKSLFESTQVINTSKNKSNMESTLHFKVLPESFNISDAGLSTEANPCAVADSGSTVKTVLQIKRIRGNSDAWCVSPRKKLCHPSRPTQLNTSESSTFQEFKKKYEEKKQRIPI